MPKKTPANAYFFYMLEFKRQEAKRGKYFYGGLSEISAAASDSWQKMTPQQREPFEAQAKERRNGPNNEFVKYSSQGIPLSQIKQEQEAQIQANQTMKLTIREMVDNSYINNMMGSQEYYFIAGNYFCKTPDDIYFPAELAIIKFTFDDGIVNKFHTYINPEKLPLGFLYPAKKHSEDSHQLPIPPKAKGEKNYELILQQIHKFIGGTTEFPPLFTIKGQIDMIQSFFKLFCNGSYESTSQYRVYPIHLLFFDVKQEAVNSCIDDKPGFQSIHVAEAQLNRDEFAYLMGTACNYHEDVDCSQYCALSCVQKWAFTFADCICPDLNIPFIPGQHFPLEVDISKKNAAELVESKMEDPEDGISWPSNDFKSKAFDGNNHLAQRDMQNPQDKSTLLSGNNPFNRRFDPRKSEFSSNMDFIPIDQSRGHESSYTNMSGTSFSHSSEQSQNSSEVSSERGHRTDNSRDRFHDRQEHSKDRYHPCRSGDKVHRKRNQ